jgi:hypothetical protein
MIQSSYTINMTGMASSMNTGSQMTIKDRTQPQRIKRQELDTNALADQ